MPTGYTAYIGEGIEFKDWVLKCARAFGALIEMRDDSLDTPIPEEFKPSDYHLKKIEEVENELQSIKLMTLEELDLKAREEYQEEINAKEDGIRKDNELRDKYIEMLSKVKSWNPPTSEHVGLKDFMIEQIESSIKFDCSGSYWENLKVVQLTAIEWRDKQINRLLSDLSYYKQKNTEEIQRTNERNLWVKQLKESLK
jgi:hypothetical protein